MAPTVRLLTERPTVAAAAGAACIASSATLVRLADVAPATAATFRCLYALPVLGVLLLREDQRLGKRPARDRRLAAAAGVFFAVDLVLWHHAIAAVGAGIATVLGNLQVVVVGFAAWWLLGERPGRRLVAAVPVVLIGVVLISGVIGSGAYGAHPGLAWSSGSGRPSRTGCSSCCSGRARRTCVGSPDRSSTPPPSPYRCASSSAHHRGMDLLPTLAGPRLARGRLR